MQFMDPLLLIYVSIVCADGSFWDFSDQLIAIDKQYKPKLSERIANASQFSRELQCIVNSLSLNRESVHTSEMGCGLRLKLGHQ